MVLVLANNIERTETSAGLRVRVAALIAHCLPLGELQVTLLDSRSFLVGAPPRAMMTPCMFRLAVVQHHAGCGEAAWVGRVAAATLSSPSIRNEGAGLYSGWCAGTPIYAFSSTLNAAVLTTAIEALPDREVDVRVLPDLEWAWRWWRWWPWRPRPT